MNFRNGAGLGSVDRGHANSEAADDLAFRDWTESDQRYTASTHRSIPCSAEGGNALTTISRSHRHGIVFNVYKIKSIESIAVQ